MNIILPSQYSLQSIHIDLIEGFYGACLHNDPDLVKKFLETGANPNQKDSHGKSILHEVCAKGYTNVARVLIEHGAKIEANGNTYNHMTPLQEACEHGHLETVQFLIEKKANVNARDIMMRTPLHFAALNGDPKIIQILLDNGANPNVANSHFESPLCLASETGNLEAVKVLFPVTEVQRGKDPLRAACFKNHTEIVEFFLENDISLDVSDKWGSTLLAVTCSTKQKTKKERDAIIRKLLERRAPISEGKDHEHPLHSACDHNFKSTMRILLEHEADVNALIYKETPLFRACIKNAYKIAKMLLLKKANPNLVNCYGALPLQQVLGVPKFSRLLLRHGARVDTLTYYQRDALYSDMIEELSSDILEEGKEDEFPQLELFRIVANLEDAFQKDDKVRQSKVLDLLVRKDQRAIDCAFSIACLRNFPQVAEIIFKLSVGVNQTDAKNNPLFPIICDKGFYEIAKLFVEHGANTVPPQAEYPGYTAFQSACAKGHASIVELLLANGANVHEKGMYGYTPLHFASTHGDPVIIQALLDNGADPLSVTNHQETPLYVAAKNGHLEAVKILYPHSKDIRDKDGNTPAHIASFNGHVDVVEFFITQSDYTKEVNLKEETLLHKACLNKEVAARNRDRLVHLLLKNGFDVNARNSFGEIPLSLTCGTGSESTSKILIEANSALDVQSKSGERNTPLLLASWKNSAATVQLLLQRGANPNIRNAMGTLPLNHADFEIAKLLLESGSETNGVYIEGTLLHTACIRGDEKMVELLLAHNANPLLKNHEGITPLRITQLDGFSNLEKMLLDKVTSEEKK